MDEPDHRQDSDMSASETSLPATDVMPAEPSGTSALRAALQSSDSIPMRDQLPEVISAAGGEVLFELSPAEAADLSWIAAVAFGEGESRRHAIVSVDADGSNARVEAAEDSDLPVARIVESYAGLLDHLRMAA